MNKRKHHIHKIERGTNGGVCLVPTKGEFDPFSTYCGDCDIYEETYTPTNKPLTCNACKHTYEILKNGIVIDIV